MHANAAVTQVARYTPAALLSTAEFRADLLARPATEVWDACRRHRGRRPAAAAPRKQLTASWS